MALLKGAEFRYIRSVTSRHIRASHLSQYSLLRAASHAGNVVTARTKSFLDIVAQTHYVQSESWQIRDIHEGIQEADAGEFASERTIGI